MMGSWFAAVVARVLVASVRLRVWSARAAGRVAFRPVLVVVCVGVVGVAPAIGAGQGQPQRVPAEALSAADPDFGAGMKLEQARAEKLRTPEAAAERERSRDRFRDLTAAAALVAGQAAFPEEFKGQLFDGTQPDPGVKVVKRLRNGTAVTQSASGKKAVLQSSLPLETEDAAGEQQPVDLSLAPDSSGFRTRNAFVDLRIAKRSRGGVSFPQGGFSISPGGGSDAAAAESSDRAFFANTQTDTDFVVAPQPAGAELGWQLRSPASPERLTLHIELPAGAVLRRARTDNPIPGDPPRSFEIAKGDDAIAYVQPPNTYDADGVPVPSTAAIEGDSIVVTVKHREGDYRFPLFVDPEVQINDYHGSNWNGWGTVATPYNPTPNTPNYYGASAANCAYYCGLYLSMPTNTAYSWNGTSIYWQYRAIANTYIYAGTLGGMGHTPSAPYAAYGATYNTYPWVFSRWFNGIFNGAFTNWEANTNYLNQAGAYGPNPFGPSWGGASGITHAFCLTAPGPRCDRENTPPSDSNALILGLSAKNDINQNDINTLGSRASVTMAWANTYLNDRYNPSINSPKPADKDWTDDSAAPDHPLNVNVLDAGLGAHDVTLTGWGTGTQTWYRSATCTGDPQRSPCPLNWSPPALSYRLNEGVNTLTLRATDIVDNTAAPQTWTEKVDRSKPTLSTPSGSLWDARENSADHRYEGVSSNQATLSVTASDSFSGIKDVQVLIDDQPTADPASRITTGGLNWTWNLNSYPIADGRHKIQIVAHDNLWVAGSSSAANHIGQTAPFYVTIDRSGDVVHAKEWDGDPATGGTSETEEWAQLSTQTSRSQMPDMIQTRQRQPCADDPNELCDEYRSTTRRRDTDGPAAPESYERTTGRAGDPNVPVVGSLLAGDASNPSATGATSAISPPWQHLPVGRGTTYARFDTPDEYNDQPATYRRYIDSQTHLPLRTEVIDSANVTQLITYWDYDLDRASVFSYQQNFFKLDKPPYVTDSTESDLRRNEAMGPQQDAQTGTMFEPQFLGSVLDRAGLGVLCLASSDYIRFSGSSPQDEVNEDPDPSVPPAQAGASAPETIVTAQYLLTPTLGACTPGTSPFDAPDVDIVSMASASAVAGAWRSAFADEGQSLSQFNGQPVYAVTREDGKLSALVDLGQTTLILTAPVAVNDVLPLLQLLQPR